MRTIATLIGTALLITTVSAHAAETGGCESFDWPLATEISWMTSNDHLSLKSGDEVDAIPDKAIKLALLPEGDVKFALAPSGASKSKPTPAYGGTLEIGKIAEAGLYQVTISNRGWIDLVQADTTLATVAHTGKSDCATVRKSLRFEVKSGPAVLQLSGVPSPDITVAIRRAE